MDEHGDKMKYNKRQVDLLSRVLEHASESSPDIMDSQRINFFRDDIIEDHSLSDNDARELYSLIQDIDYDNTVVSDADEKKVLQLLYKTSSDEDVYSPPLWEGMCPPGYEYVPGYHKSDRTYVKSFCRKKHNKY